MTTFSINKNNFEIITKTEIFQHMILEVCIFTVRLNVQKPFLKKYCENHFNFSSFKKHMFLLMVKQMYFWNFYVRRLHE